MEAERQTEAVGQRELIVDRIAGIERPMPRIRILFARMARQDRATVGGYRQPHVARARLDPAVEPGSQVARPGGIVGGETEVVDEDQEAPFERRERGEQRRK